ncbi:MAG: hypothetical protein ACK4VZ_01160 [Paracoccaceae bacterium]
MKRTLMALTLGLALSGTMALAVTPDEIVGNLQAAGYSRVEVRVGPTQIKVEAIRGTEKLEVVYDAATGAVLKTETGVVRGDRSTSAGVKVRTDNRDFVRTGSGSDEGDDHDGRGEGRGAVTQGSGHDSSSGDDRDHGEDDSGHGSDDSRSSDDDHGSDDNGSDDDNDDSSDDDHGSDDSDGSDDDSDH